MGGDELRHQGSQVTEAVNIKHGDAYDVYGGRKGSGLDGPFGNYVEEGQNRYERVANFRAYFKKRIEEDQAYRDSIIALRGKRLGCFCMPLRCHLMVIVEYLEGLDYDQQVEAYKQKYLVKKGKTKPLPKPPKWEEPDMFS